MYYPFRHDASVKESMLNSSASSLIESNSPARPFPSSFSAQSGSAAAFPHTGNLQGLHNMQGNYNVPTMASSLPTRNSGLTGLPIALSSGGLQAGHFTANNLPVALSQLSHGGMHGHGGGVGSRTGLSVGGNMKGTVAPASPNSGSVSNRTGAGLGISSTIIGGATGRMPGSAGSMITGGTGGNLGRNLNSVSGFNIPNLSGSRMNMGQSSITGSIGPGRPLSNVPQQVPPQLVSLLSNNFSNSLGIIGGNVQASTGNGHLTSLGLVNDATSNDGVPFDINDFPQLSTHPSSGGSQAALASLRKQAGVNPIVQQSQEFSIQNEDFPALPGFKGGNDFSGDLHQKDSQHENAFALLQSPHFTMGRSTGYTLGSSYVPHRQAQQQSQLHAAPIMSTTSTSGSFAVALSSDLLQLQAGPDMFQAQAVGIPGANSSQLPMGNLRALGNPITNYDQLMQQYQQQFNYRLGAHQPLSAVGQPSREQGSRLIGVDRFGLLGLLGVIRLSNPDLSTLALGQDLTTLGLNLNSRESLYKTFASPWADGPLKGEPEFTLPQCYSQQAPNLQPEYFTKFQQGTLFYVFYSMPNDDTQLYAANELCNRGWFYHKDIRMWFTRVPNMEPLVTTNSYERGSYYFFDPSSWDIGRKDNFVVYYESVEKSPQLPQHK